MLRQKWRAMVSKRADLSVLTDCCVAEFMKQSCVAPYLQVFDDFMAGLETTFQAERVARAREVRGQESMEF